MQFNAAHGSTEIALVQSTFRCVGQPGDFAHEIAQECRGSRPPHGRRTLWIFNDSVEHRMGAVKGDGNAAARPYNRFGDHGTEPFSAGVTTGTRGRGFTELSAQAKAVIDEDLAAIARLLQTGQYGTVKYSADARGGLGTGIFRVAHVVKDYIVMGLVEVTSSQGHMLAGQRVRSSHGVARPNAGTNGSRARQLQGGTAAAPGSGGRGPNSTAAAVGVGKRAMQTEPAAFGALAARQPRHAQAAATGTGRGAAPRSVPTHGRKRTTGTGDAFVILEAVSVAKARCSVSGCHCLYKE